MATQLDLRQSVLRVALSMAGSAINATGSSILPLIDAEIAKLYEDRNILLTDGGLITFTGTQIQFSENLNLTINQKISGAVPQIISLGSASQNFTSSGDMMIAVINRTAGTAVVSIVTSGSALPAVVAANQEVFLIAKRVDAGDGTQRLYWRNGMALNAGQTVRLGASGSGSGGTGIGDDLDSLLFRASFDDEFSESASSSTSAVDATAGHTNGTYNAAKGLYQLSYDASKTGTSTGTAFTLSGTPAFTVAAGDVVVNPSTLEVRKIASISSQVAYTLESAFSTNLAATAVTVSQAVHSKDIYNLSVDGSAISAAFGSATFSEILVDYEDNSTVGDGVFHPNVAPVIGYSASPDGTTFSNEYVRATNDTDTFNSIVMSSAGIALYMRFYANKTSGSGTVNLLRYKVFVQKLVASGTTPSNGVANAAYALSNGAGTPYNCSLSTVASKTRVILNFNYAVGVNVGSPYGSIDVLVNGQLVPRFISTANNASGAYYTEINGNTIQLDSDYSATASDIVILQRTQIIDSATTNTTSISALQDASNQGFQGFVNNTSFLITATTVTGAPAVGTFYSTVSNRASLVDFSQDLKPRMGIERISVQQISQMISEFGPNGEPVWLSPNDSFGQIRFIGASWASNNNQSGVRATASVSGDYCEITFYGTGVNVLTTATNNGEDVRVSTDGGSEGSNIYPGATASSVLTGRNYTPNEPINGVSGLSLGIHTVKFRTNNSSASFNVDGFEILTESSSIKVQPGISYVGGQKLVLSSQNSFSYSAPVTGTRGGRVLVYQASDGTIGKAFQAVNGAQANLGAADHTNEEIARVYNWREFSASRSDDFSQQTGNPVNASFVLDDGTTILQAKGINFTATNPPTLFLSGSGVPNYFALTFVGTGLDIVNTSTSITDAYTVVVNGTSIGTISTAAQQKIKLVSGLPYGTHVVTVTRSASAGGADLAISQFVVYQPKKPTLPTGAVELGDYNVLANYANAGVIGGGIEWPATGVLRKSCSREVVAVGTWTYYPYDGTVGPSITTSTAASYVEYTFFGTGINHVFSLSATGINYAYTIDGVANIGSLGGSTSFISSQTGTVTFSSSTGILSGTASGTPDNNTASITGLTLGLHKIRVTYTSAGSPTFDSFDVITPIHSVKSNLVSALQDTLPIGSCGISDNRKSSPVKSESIVKSWFRAVQYASIMGTSTSTSYVPVPGLAGTLRTNTGKVEINALINFVHSDTGNVTYGIFVDGVVYSEFACKQSTSNNRPYQSVNDILYLPSGAHLIQIMYKRDSGTTSDNGAFLNAKEIL